MDWYDITGKFHEQTLTDDCRLSSLAYDWQRELAALWRLEADVNNGAYLQFLTNWGRESYAYAGQALRRIGAHKMAEIVDCCQALVDEHFDPDAHSDEAYINLMPNMALDREGNVIKEAGSILPDAVVKRIYDLSYQFMDYPDDIAALGLIYYRQFIPGEV